MKPSRETLLCEYHYDPLDRLTSHALPDTPERQRFYCKSRLATDMQGAMSYSIVQQGDQLLAEQHRQGDSLNTTLLATDLQRSVLQTIKADHPPKPIAYSPYGHRPFESGLLSLIGFNGERSDPVTGCYLLGNGYRAFNPAMMRFNSQDSLSPFGRGGLNPYTYCLNDPITRRDPNGHVSFRAIVHLLRSIYRMKRQQAPVIKGPTITIWDETGYPVSFIDEFATRHTLSPDRITINNPNLKQLSFSNTPGKQLQNTAKLNRGHHALITNLDLELGDINLHNHTNNLRYDIIEKNVATDTLEMYKKNVATYQNSQSLALIGDAPGVLPSRAKLRSIRDPDQRLGYLIPPGRRGNKR